MVKDGNGESKGRKMEPLGRFLARFAVWMAVSSAIFDTLGLLTDTLLFVCALVGFLLVAEFSRPELFRAGWGTGVRVVTVGGFVWFLFIAYQWVLGVIQNLAVPTTP
jgi:hypothetical protein